MRAARRRASSMQVCAAPRDQDFTGSRLCKGSRSEPTVRGRDGVSHRVSGAISRSACHLRLLTQIHICPPPHMHTVGANLCHPHTPPPHTCQNEFPSPRSPHGHVGAPPSSTLSTKTNLDEIWSSPDLLEQYEKARWADMIIFMSPPYSHPSLPNPNADRAHRPVHTVT
jgi:hypothetical protein